MRSPGSAGWRPERRLLAEAAGSADGSGRLAAAQAGHLLWLSGAGTGWTCRRRKKTATVSEREGHGSDLRPRRPRQRRRRPPSRSHRPPRRRPPSGWTRGRHWWRARPPARPPPPPRRPPAAGPPAAARARPRRLAAALHAARAGIRAGPGGAGAAGRGANVATAARACAVRRLRAGGVPARAHVHSHEAAALAPHTPVCTRTAQGLPRGASLHAERHGATSEAELRGRSGLSQLLLLVTEPPRASTLPARDRLHCRCHFCGWSVKAHTSLKCAAAPFLSATACVTLYCFGLHAAASRARRGRGASAGLPLA